MSKTCGGDFEDKFIWNYRKGKDMKKNRNRIFEYDKIIFSTPDVFDKDGSRVGKANIYINIYGDVVAEVSNRHTGTGYYSESIASFCSALDNETLDYLLTELQRERKQRERGKMI